MNKMLRSTLCGFVLVAMGLCMFATASHAGDTSYGMPLVIKPSGRYLFFHHNYYVENKGADGECKYRELLQVFTGMGFTVVSEIRPKDASVLEYADKGAANVRKLLDAGVPPENITVAGHSKGGVITLRIAALLEQPKVNYLVLAGCGIKGLEKGYPDFSKMKGNFLSLYATSDKVAGSCAGGLGDSRDGIVVNEVKLENSAGHQLFFTPSDLWLQQVAAWVGPKK